MKYQLLDYINILKNINNLSTNLRQMFMATNQYILSKKKRDK